MTYAISPNFEATIAPMTLGVLEDIGYTVNYNVTIYLARIIAAVLSVEGVANVTGLTINGSATDLSCTETSALQQIPEMGTVTIH